MTVPFPMFTHNWVLNLIEFFMFYFIVSNIVDVKTKKAIEALSFKMMALGLIHSTIIATSWVILERHYLQTALSYNAVFLLTLFIVKHHQRNKISLGDTIVVYFIQSIVGYILITPAFIIVSLLGYNENVTNFLTFVLGLTTVMFVCSYADLNKLFLFITRSLMVKFALVILFILISHFVIMFSFFGFGLGYLALFLIVTLLSLIGLGYISKSAYEYTEVMPEQIHDVKKLLNSLQIQAKRATSMEELKTSISEVVNLVGIQVLEEDKVVDESFESFTLETVEQIRQDKGKHAIVVTDIQYFENRKGISDTVIAYILGVLLDNAIETLTKKPIYVDLFVSEYVLSIKVKNESNLKESELEKIMKKGYSSKRKVGRGFGLPKLKRIVESKGGRLLAEQAIHEEEGVNYLTLTVHL